MKKLYTLGIALSMVAFGTQSFAQVNKTVNFAPEYPTAERTVATDNQLVKGNLDAKSTDVEVYWSEDFSNGLAGQNAGQPWTFDLANGELWFQTFPAGQPNAYDPLSPLTVTTAYGDALSGYYGTAAEVNSPTRDNGFMMLDATRWDNGGGDPIVSALVSPSLDLSSFNLTTANLVFWQRLRMCCAGSGLVANAEVSVDGGTNWVPYDVFYPFGSTNDNINQEIKIDISDAIQGAAPGNTLNNVKVRFLWAGAQTNYFWQIDDVSIEALEDNDLKAGKTYYNNHKKGLKEYNAGTIDGTEYLSTFENSRTPTYFARPLTLGMAVTNKGSETQTGVSVVITGIAPDGSTFDVGTTDPISMPYGMTDTLNIEDYTIPNLQPGLYKFAYEVIQNEADAVPANNIGDTTVTRFTEEVDGAGAVMQNPVNVNGGAYPFADNIIWSTGYSFPQTAEGVGPKYITHVEAVFMYTEGFAPTVVGTTVYFNVRKGSLIDEDPDVPASLTTVEFGNDPLNYEGVDIEFTIGEDDVWNTVDGMAAYHYASFELPTPVLIEPNVAYQAEVRIPFGNLVYLPVNDPEETYGTLVYLFNYNANSPGWYTLGKNVMPLRFKVATGPIGIEKVTYETGITLVQNYPNPFTDVTRIQYSVDKSDNVKLEVRDIAGKLVFQKDMGTVPAGMPQSYELQRGNLAPGMYTYSIVTSEYQVSRKLTVQ